MLDFIGFDNSHVCRVESPGHPRAEEQCVPFCGVLLLDLAGSVEKRSLVCGIFALSSDVCRYQYVHFKYIVGCSTSGNARCLRFIRYFAQLSN